MSLACERVGEGPPLLLLHGTTSSRTVWKPVLDRLAERFECFALDLPGHGDSPATSFTPPDFARDIAGWMEAESMPVVGHSVGGWTALELAKLGRASAVLSLVPAGFWPTKSPLMTNVALAGGYWAGRLSGGLGAPVLRTKLGRRLALRAMSAAPAAVDPEIAIEAARVSGANRAFPRHFRETRGLRFEGGQELEIPIRIVWGADDRVAGPRNRELDQLPPGVPVETWEDCGHMVMWDQPDRLVEAVRALA